jgi:hypothetical protein
MLVVALEDDHLYVRDDSAKTAPSRFSLANQETNVIFNFDGSGTLQLVIGMAHSFGNFWLLELALGNVLAIKLLAADS